MEQRDPSFSEMSTAAAPVAGQRPKGEMVRATVTFEMEFELLVLASGVIPHSPEAHSWCSSGDWTGPKGASAWESPKTGATRSTTSGIMVPPPTRPQRVIWHSPESFLGFLDSSKVVRDSQQDPTLWHGGLRGAVGGDGHDGE